MMRKILTAFIAVILIVCNIPVHSEESEIIIDSLSVDETGYAEAIGHIIGWNRETQVTFLVMTDKGNSESVITGDTILYIDQIGVGNNGVFLFKFQVPAKFSETEAVFRFGTDSGAAAVSENLTIPKLPPGIANVINNSVLYGQDVYTLDSVHLYGEFVLDSIVYGGNVIFFKLGNEWYNLLDSDAKSATFLVPENATSIDYMEKLPLRYYYARGKKVEFGTGAHNDGNNHSCVFVVRNLRRLSRRYPCGEQINKLSNTAA